MDQFPSHSRWMHSTAAAIVITNLFAAAPAHAVTYRVTFTGSWTADQVAPNTYPGGAHFSPMVGSSHKPGQGFWQPGETASAGVESVAELGTTGTLQSEIQTEIAAGDANNFISVAGNLFNLPNSGSTTFTTSSTFNQVTLISMVAPSPDWFVGVYNQQLQQDGKWLSDFTVDLQSWDAGTEEGTGFSLSNSATSPLEPIALLQGVDSPFIGQPVVGSIRFELVSNPALSDLGERGVQVSRVDFETQTVTLTNLGGVEEPLDGWRFCTHNEGGARKYSAAGGLNGITLAPGETLNIHFLNDASADGQVNISTIGGDFATPLTPSAYGMQLYFDSVIFGNGDTIADHLQWSLKGVDNATADERSDEAENGGVWADQSEWIATTPASTSINLIDLSGASLHSPANYSVEPSLQVNVPTMPYLTLGGMAALLVGIAKKRFSFVD